MDDYSSREDKNRSVYNFQGDQQFSSILHSQTTGDCRCSCTFIIYELNMHFSNSYFYIHAHGILEVLPLVSFLRVTDRQRCTQLRNLRVGNVWSVNYEQRPFVSLPRKCVSQAFYYCLENTHHPSKGAKSGTTVKTRKILEWYLNVRFLCLH